MFLTIAALLAEKQFDSLHKVASHAQINALELSMSRSISSTFK